MKSKYENFFITALKGEHYFTNENIRMNIKYGFMLTNLELNEYLRFKEDNSFGCMY